MATTFTSFNDPTRYLTLKYENGVPRLADALSGELIAGVKNLQISVNPNEIMTGQIEVAITVSADIIFGVDRSNAPI